MRYYLLWLSILFYGCGHINTGCPSPVIPKNFGKQSIATDEYPATGKLWLDGGWCTATLIAPDVIVTAAHCALDGADWGPEGSRKYHVIAWASMKARDLAFGVLESVPENIEPVRASERAPRPDETLVMVGYGCADACVRPDGSITHNREGIRRKGEFSAAGWEPVGYRSDVFSICPGDSGGPVYIKETGEMIAVASALQVEGEGSGTRWTRQFYEDVVGLW